MRCVKVKFEELHAHWQFGPRVPDQEKPWESMKLRKQAALALTVGMVRSTNASTTLFLIPKKAPRQKDSAEELLLWWNGREDTTSRESLAPNMWEVRKGRDERR